MRCATMLPSEWPTTTADHALDELNAIRGEIGDRVALPRFALPMTALIEAKAPDRLRKIPDQSIEA